MDQRGTRGTGRRAAGVGAKTQSDLDDANQQVKDLQAQIDTVLAEQLIVEFYSKN